MIHVLVGQTLSRYRDKLRRHRQCLGLHHNFLQYPNYSQLLDTHDQVDERHHSLCTEELFSIQYTQLIFDLSC